MNKITNYFPVPRFVKNLFHHNQNASRSSRFLDFMNPHLIRKIRKISLKIFHHHKNQKNEKTSSRTNRFEKQTPPQPPKNSSNRETSQVLSETPDVINSIQSPSSPTRRIKLPLPDFNLLPDPALKNLDLPLARVDSKSNLMDFSDSNTVHAVWNSTFPPNFPSEEQSDIDEYMSCIEPLPDRDILPSEIASEHFNSSNEAITNNATSTEGARSIRLKLPEVELPDEFTIETHCTQEKDLEGYEWIKLKTGYRSNPELVAAFHKELIKKMIEDVDGPINILGKKLDNAKELNPFVELVLPPHIVEYGIKPTRDSKGDLTAHEIKLIVPKQEIASLILNFDDPGIQNPLEDSQTSPLSKVMIDSLKATVNYNLKKEKGKSFYEIAFTRATHTSHDSASPIFCNAFIYDLVATLKENIVDTSSMGKFKKTAILALMALPGFSISAPGDVMKICLYPTQKNENPSLMKSLTATYGDKVTDKTFLSIEYKIKNIIAAKVKISSIPFATGAIESFINSKITQSLSFIKAEAEDRFFYGDTIPEGQVERHFDKIAKKPSQNLIIPSSEPNANQEIPAIENID